MTQKRWRRPSPRTPLTEGQIAAAIHAARGASVFVVRDGDTWKQISKQEAQAFKDAGRAAHVQEVWTTDPDPDAFAWLVEQAPSDVRDEINAHIRQELRAHPEVLLRGIQHLRRIAHDSKAAPKDRRMAAECLTRYGYDDASLSHDEPV